MHYVLQENLFHEEGMRVLVDTLERMGLPYSLHKVVPFVGEIIPDIDPEGPVVAFGAYSMLRTARRKGWVPGVWSNDQFDFSYWGDPNIWGHWCLNGEAEIYPFGEVPHQSEPFFMRPTMDSKQFAGQIFEWSDYEEWRKRVVELKEDDGSTLRSETPVLVAPYREILREYRLW